ncbi:hypothetical protein DXG01_016177 [Tephrocybe rancida]|nr:hypothetical protein DXG01_016177 [Tephrocybe rancida]
MLPGSCSSSPTLSSTSFTIAGYIIVIVDNGSKHNNITGTLEDNRITASAATIAGCVVGPAAAPATLLPNAFTANAFLDLDAEEDLWSEDEIADFDDGQVSPDVEPMPQTVDNNKDKDKHGVDQYDNDYPLTLHQLSHHRFADHNDLDEWRKMISRA